MHYSIQNNSGAVRVTMEGKFTFNDSRSFQLMLHAMKTMLDAAEIRLNLERLESIDAMALGMLLIAFDAMKQKHRSLVFEAPQGQVHEALKKAANHNALHIA